MNQLHDNMDTINSNMNKDYLLAFVNADNNWLILRTDEQLYTVSSCPNKMKSMNYGRVGVSAYAGFSTA